MIDNPETNDCHTDYLHDNQHNPIDPHSVCDPGTHHPDMSCKRCETGEYESNESLACDEASDLD